MISMNAIDEPTPAERSRAANVVAEYARDEAECEILLDMLGLTPTESPTARPNVHKVTESAAARCRRRYQAIDAFDPDAIRLRSRRGIRRAG